MSRLNDASFEQSILEKAASIAVCIPVPPPNDPITLSVHSYDHKYVCSYFSTVVQDEKRGLVDIVFRLKATMDAMNLEPVPRTSCCSTPYRGILKSAFNVGVISMMVIIFCQSGNQPRQVQIDFINNIAQEMLQSYPPEVVSKWTRDILEANGL